MKTTSICARKKQQKKHKLARYIGRKKINNDENLLQAILKLASQNCRFVSIEKKTRRDEVGHRNGLGRANRMRR